MPPKKRPPAKKTVPWNRAAPAPIVLISGSEAVLVRKAQDRIIEAVRRTADPELIRLDASSYEPGELLMAAAPSLFSSQKLIIVDAVAQCSDAFLQDALAYVEEVQEDAVVVLKHSGGQRGAKLLKAVTAAGHPQVDAAVLKSDADKSAFAAAEFTSAGRTIEQSALAALLSALGSDLSELYAGIEQLVQDTEGTITQETVDRYYGGRVEATGFRVADAAVAGRTAEALTLLRHALATGTDPVPLVAAVAMKLRAMARVEGRAGSSAQLAGELKMAPWQVDRARRDLRTWNDMALGRAMLEAAQADEDVKGGGRDPVYAVERLITVVCAQAAVRP